MAYTDLRYEVSAPLATITLDRPDARNAYSEAMVSSLLQAFDSAADDDSVRAVILTGAGKSFHAGGDLKRMQDERGMFAGGPVELR